MPVKENEGDTAAKASGPGQCSNPTAEPVGISANVPIASEYGFVNHANAIEATWGNRRIAIVADARAEVGFMIYCEREKPADYDPENEAGFEVFDGRLVKRFYLTGEALCAISAMVGMLRDGRAVIRASAIEVEIPPSSADCNVERGPKGDAQTQAQ